MNRTFTFLFTDIEGSTRLWERPPEAMRRALDVHNSILSRAIDANGGRVFRTVGDAFCASFPNAAGAVQAAAEAQRALFAETWEGLEYPLRVRIALHAGEAEEQDGDYIGSTLNRVARLLAVCRGGQTLLTGAAEQLARYSLPPGASLLDLGEHRLRDLSLPERVFQLSVEGLPASFPPLPTGDSVPNNLPRHNLPPQLTSFVGRAGELAKLREMLHDHRLVTLHGPGGTGKTRLALQAASQSLADYPGGAWLVELAPLSDPSLILPALAGVLGVRSSPPQPLLEAIVNYLREKKALLLLDNCEHLIEDCARLAEDLLRACPRLSFLATSRETLDVYGEMPLRVPSLSIPPASASLAELSRSESALLFAERAAAARPGFTLTSENAPAVAQICRRLDGIPLALELAAARVKLLSPEGIASRLDDRFRLLTGGSRTALPRQRTLEALIDWSYDLLSEPERLLFRRLSVFMGGWTLEAAEEVTGDQGSDRSALVASPLSLVPSAVLDLLSQLVDKSLVIADENGPETRYRMLETIRQYAQEKLFESGEASELRDRHMQYFGKLAHEAGQGFRTQGWLIYTAEALAHEDDNLRLAQEWALEHDLDRAVEMTGNLLFYWNRTGGIVEAAPYVEAVIRKARSSPEYSGELAPERVHYWALALITLGMVRMILGDNAGALPASREAVEVARRGQDPGALCLGLCILAEDAGFLGDSVLAHTAGEEAIALARQSGDKVALATVISFVSGWAFRALGEGAAVKESLGESIRLLRELNDRRALALADLMSAFLALESGDLDTAEHDARASLQVVDQLGELYFATVSRSLLGDIARQRGRWDESAGLYRETISSWLKLGNPGAVARCLECLAFIEIDQSAAQEPSARRPRLQRAAELLGKAGALREASRFTMTPMEQAEYDAKLADLRRLSAESGFSADDFDASCRRGRSLEIDTVSAPSP